MCVLLDLPASRKGKRIAESEADRIRAYYDEQSVDRAEARETILVKDSNGLSTRVGKKLLSVPIDALYKEYRSDSEIANIGYVGRTKFFQLKPKYIVTADKYGMQSICVCIYHQNALLMLSSLQIADNKGKYWFLHAMMCDIDSYACAFSKCLNCPGGERLRSELDSHVEEGETIAYSQWVSSDNKRCALQKFQCESRNLSRHFWHKWTF